ncbi:copper amine oxidase N-terminal domain-containing protein [Paenibacillus sp. GCM10027627]|uniref:copper amine oxidase N-terminal domain-containing protein n=1 Tax=unclassified Paenibacillus TaxID=185978 RepID=UPI003631413C
MFKKTIAALLAAILLTGGITTATAAPGKDLRIIPVIVNGQKVRFPDTEPYINTDGRTMVPVRFVSEKLGAEVKWEAATETATIKYRDKTIKLPVGSKTVTVNDEKQELDTAAEFADGRTMVPLRFVSEVLESKVEWDEGAHAVKVSDKAYQDLVTAGKAKLDPWGREYSKTWDPYWMKLTDLEKTGFYNVTYKSKNKSLVESIQAWDMKTYVDQWSEHIRDYYAAQLNVDYRTINEKTFANTLISNMTGMSSYQEGQIRDHIFEYVKWVKKNKVIAKGYADPENSQIEGSLISGVSIRVHFKFKIISANDTAQTFLDNWNISTNSDSYKLEKGVWYSGYSRVVLWTHYANYKYMHYAVRSVENMFAKDAYKYEKLK